ncbi:MAG: hypothetical protein PHU77_00035 [Simplicispira sp.]|nr:hypothetical protein [Simplicispira sp.]
MTNTLGPNKSWRLVHDGEVLLLLDEIEGITETTHSVFEAATRRECVAQAERLGLMIPEGVVDQAEQMSLQEQVVAATQTRLDDFARTRNYDGILSACTYATSTVPKFAAEGQYAVQARDATWAALYGLLEEVQAGTRPVPAGFGDVEPLLPAMEWPV